MLRISHLCYIDAALLMYKVTLKCAVMYLAVSRKKCRGNLTAGTSSEEDSDGAGLKVESKHEVGSAGK